MSVGTSVSAAPVYMAERIPLGVGNNRAVPTAINDSGFVTACFLQLVDLVDRETLFGMGKILYRSVSTEVARQTSTTATPLLEPC